MSIRTKIFVLAGILLALFGVVVGTLATMQKLDGEQIGNIVNYEQPLSHLVSELDVDTDRYELNIIRLLRLDNITRSDIETTAANKKTLEGELRESVTAINELLSRAIQDTNYHSEDRVELARLEGSLKYIVRHFDGFLAIGDQTMQAIAEGKHSEAKTISLGFRKYSEAFGPDLSEIRRSVAGLTDRATRTVLKRQRINTYLSFALFLAACGVGLGISAVGSARVVSGLRHLVTSARAVASGTNAAPVVVLTRDEVGELAMSFNRMIEELRSESASRTRSASSSIPASSIS